MIGRKSAQGLLVALALASAACGSTTTAPGLGNATGGASGGAASGGAGLAGGASDSGSAEPIPHGIPLGSACPKDGAKGSFTGGWSRQIPVIRPQSFDLPIPPGGNVGVLQLVLHSQTADEARVELGLEGPLARMAAVRPLHAEIDTLTVLVTAGRTYTLRLSQPIFNGNGAEFELDWEYTPLADCNEPNDTVWTANQVSPGDTIEGYVIAGGVGQYVPIVATQDWFWVALPEPGSLTLTVEQALRSSIAITGWNGTGEVQLASLRNPATQVVAEGLPAGNYAFQVAATTDWPGSSNETTGDWRQLAQAAPYRLSVAFAAGPASSTVIDKLGINQGALPSFCREDSNCGARRTCVDGSCYDPRNPPATGLPCKTDGQCRFDDVCENGLCATPTVCQTNDDCASGRTCAFGRCLLGTFRPCTGDAAGGVCADGTRCENGSCQPTKGCGVGFDCPVGQRCDNANCVAAPVCFDDSACNSGERCVLGRCSVPKNGCTGTTCGIGGFCSGDQCEAPTIGKPCFANEDCRYYAGYCDLLFTGTCRRLCQTEQDCEQNSEYSYAHAFAQKYICREAVNAYGVRQQECQATCESELQCPFSQSCTGMSSDLKYCEFPNVSPW